MSSWVLFDVNLVRIETQMIGESAHCLKLNLMENIRVLINNCFPFDSNSISLKSTIIWNDPLLGQTSNCLSKFYDFILNFRFDFKRNDQKWWAGELGVQQFRSIDIHYWLNFIGSYN